MPFGLVSAWRKRSSKLQEIKDQWTYKPLEEWNLKDQSLSFGRRKCSVAFTLKEMEEATNSFSERNLIGKGGFGRVYKGILANGQIVAIKKMGLPASKQADGEREFRFEVDLMSRLDHTNLVALIGYCADGNARILVYEYMSRGNLQDVLNGLSDLKLDWPLRLSVALGAARGLAYLHSNSEVGIPIVHRDFKSTNILLSDTLKAKICDFGLAKLMPEDEGIHATTRMFGTFGYFDPEYASTGKLTLQSDVYAFGVVLLELLTGRQALELSQGTADQNLILQFRNIVNVRKKLRKMIDPEIPRQSYTMENISKFADLASRCVRIESSARPTMEECVKLLQLILYASRKA
ncbi:probable serine/threonine-protein kinase PBL28 isoform X2 [Phalaenopsis equestris]|uniref:probable serine/threonine-protein kinase PBL28 isoform X2 n=1 Tax=Phalaenopsis equestris TaxID=78828 RepID=UPI0009E22BAD|nr:probable serine/threonine-protein kinase PBL28 isoform X2 [Phalaenopsis equestris]